MTRVVIDTNVYISALIGRRGAAPDLVLRAFIDDRVEVVVSSELLAEIERVLARPKLLQRVDRKQAAEYVERIRRHAESAADTRPVPAVTRDRSDDYLVALARSAHVDAIVSGDPDLLDAGIDDPPVWTPRQLVEKLGVVPDTA